MLPNLFLCTNLNQLFLTEMFGKIVETPNEKKFFPKSDYGISKVTGLANTRNSILEF